LRAQLGQEIHIPVADAGQPHVYEFTGRKGQKLVAQLKQEAEDARYGVADVSILTLNGEYVDGSLLMGEDLAPVLPADGTYKVLVQSYVNPTSDVNLTIYDVKDAPTAAKSSPGVECPDSPNCTTLPGQGIGEAVPTCPAGSVGIQTCVLTGPSGSRPTTVAAAHG
jgi:hypothetical protein